MAKNILRVAYIFDFQLIALVSPVKDYRLCWLLNKLLGFNFVRQQDIEINFPKRRRVACFSRYSYADEPGGCEYYLLENKVSGEFLLPERKEADFLLMLKGEKGFSLAGIIDKIKTLPEVQTAFEVNTEKLKSKENLLFFDEPAQKLRL